MADRPNYTLVQLRYFAVAAELGSMTAAAKRLSVSQSAVSTAVAHLEDELAVQLLIRHHAKGLSLTAAGRRFQRELANFLAHADELTEAAGGPGAALAGRLTVGCYVALAPFLLPRLLSGFAAQQPDVRVSTVEGAAGELERSLFDGSCELALTYAQDLADGLAFQQLGAAPPYVLVSAGHRLAGRTGGIRLAEVAGEPFVLYDLPHSRRYCRVLVAGAAAEPRHRSSDRETVRALVGAGHGYSILDQRPAGDRTYDGGRVTALPLLDEAPPLAFGIAHVRGVRLTRRARLFAQHCQALFGQPGAGGGPAT